RRLALVARRPALWLVADLARIWRSTAVGRRKGLSVLDDFAYSGRYLRLHLVRPGGAADRHLHLFRGDRALMVRGATSRAAGRVGARADRAHVAGIDRADRQCRPRYDRPGAVLHS